MEYISKEQLNALYDEDAVTMKGWAMIKQMPTIDIVCCRECKHLMFSDCYGECAKGYRGIVQPDDYCKHGERRTDGEGS